MPLIGNQLASGENNSFRVLDNIASYTLTFDGSSSSTVSVANNLITLYAHPFITGQRVTYSSGGGNPIGGLISGTAYYIIKIDQNTFRLATTYADSLQSTNLISIVGTGTGVTHSFNVAFDGINTKFKATYSNGTKCSISRAAQLDIAINGVLQQPYDSNPPPNGFTIEADSTIVFSTAPLAGYTFWGKVLTNAIASFETSDNTVDTFTGNGTQVNFTLSKTPANNQNVLVTVNGVVQYPTDVTAARSYSVNANVLSFTAAPSNGSVIQVRHIGFAGATTSAVTGFYGRTGNVVLTSSDNIAIGTAKIGPVVGVNTTLLVEGNARITGILTIGTGSITLDGNTNTISGMTISSPSFTGIATFSSGPVLIGSGTSTGTASQPLQVSGGAYVSGSVGIGTTNPSQKFHLLSNGGAIALIESTTNYDGNIRVKNTGAQYLIGMLGSPGSTSLSFYDVNAGQSRMSIDSSGNLQFNSGYGSAATAYGCRAWVNFNGTTASPSTIRGSGNVTSVTKNGTGDYTVNFTTALVDANYSVVCGGRRSSGTLLITNTLPGGTYTANAVQVNSASATPANADADYYNVAVFR